MKSNQQSKSTCGRWLFATFELPLEICLFQHALQRAVGLFHFPSFGVEPLAAAESQILLQAASEVFWKWMIVRQKYDRSGEYPEDLSRRVFSNWTSSWVDMFSVCSRSLSSFGLTFCSALFSSEWDWGSETAESLISISFFFANDVVITISLSDESERAFSVGFSLRRLLYPYSIVKLYQNRSYLWSHSKVKKPKNRTLLLELQKTLKH